MANIRRYWILQTELSRANANLNQVLEHREVPVSRNSEIQAGDIVFLWSRDDRNLCGWGDVSGELLPAPSVNQSGQIGISITPNTLPSGSPSSLRRRIIIVIQAFFADGVSINPDQVQRIIGSENFENLSRDQFHAIELSAEQVVAINDQLPKGATPPLDNSWSVNPPSPQESPGQQNVSSQDNQSNSGSSGESVHQEVSAENPDSNENTGSTFNQQLADAKTISSFIQQTTVLFEMAQERANAQSIDEAAVAFGFANTAAAQINDAQLKDVWTKKIRETAQQYGLKFIEGKEIAERENNTATQNATESQTTTSEAVTDADTENDFKSRLPSINADVYTDKDLLGIEADVEPFAQLIAARSVDPPLSIGLFGDWGSGKTFFMRHLRKRVEEIATEAEVSGFAQKDMAFYKRIVQIEFNAWHYSESNLWASMVEHIFQNLRILETDKPNELEERRNALLKKIEIENLAQIQTKKEEDRAKTALQNKEEEIKEIEKKQKEEIKKLEALSIEDISASVKESLELNPQVQTLIAETLQATGIEKVGDSLTELQASLAAAKSVVSRGSSLFLPLVRAQDRKKRIAMLLVILLAAPIIGILIDLILRQLGTDGMSKIYAFFSSLAVFISMAATWILKQVQWVSHWLGKIENAKELVDKQIEKQVTIVKATHEKEIAIHKQQLEVLTAKYITLRNEREEAQRRVEQIREELRQTTPVQWLSKFIQDRAASEDYRKHLGLLALIRRDFENLSNFLSEENKSLLEMKWEDEQKEKANRVNRIVLYIDDLDRCQPSQVVAVLQAVHLLLAFKLFIVVVGVDCRWVMQSLRKQYPELLSDGQPAQSATDKQEPLEKLTNFHAASSRDYLEKIFQIPFWLNPMTATSTVSLLKGILEPSVVKDKVATTQGQKTETPNVENNSSTQNTTGTGSATSNKDRDANTQQATSQNEGQTTGGKPVSLEKFNLNPKSLNLRERELKFMEALAPILGRSPRSVKRFINIYRLIKVGLSPQEHVEFIKVKSPISQYQAVMILLAIETGFPKLSAKLLSALLDDIEHANQARQLGVELSKFGKENPEDQEVVDRLLPCLAPIENIKRDDLEFVHFTIWAPLISRYSFNTERS